MPLQAQKSLNCTELIHPGVRFEVTFSLFVVTKSSNIQSTRMKIIFILFNIVFLGILIAAPALKKINLIRLLTVIMLMIYSIGVVKMIFLFPMSSLLSLGAGMVAVLCMAFLFRQGPARSGMKQTDPKIRMLNNHRNDVRMKRNGLNFKKELRLSSN